ncbi:MAG: hypothetical protein V3U73_11345, partial [bacterium]
SLDTWCNKHVFYKGMPSLLQKIEDRHLKSNGAWLALLICFSGLALIPAIPTAQTQFSDNAASTKIQNPAEVGDDISRVEPGQYEFLVEITDRNSNQKKSRKISFEIVE